MKNRDNIQKDIDAILEVEYLDMQQHSEGLKILRLDDETQQAVDEITQLNISAATLSEEEYLQKRAAFEEEHPNFGKATEKDFKQSIQDAQRQKAALLQLPLTTEEGKELRELHIKNLDLDIRVYEFLLESDAVSKQAEIEAIENESFEVTMRITDFLEEYGY